MFTRQNISFQKRKMSWLGKYQTVSYICGGSKYEWFRTNLDAFAVLTRYSLIIKQIPKINDQETFSRMDFETGYALQHEKQKVLRFIDKAVENKLNFIALMFSPPNKINASFNIRNVAIVAGS